MKARFALAALVGVSFFAVACGGAAPEVKSPDDAASATEEKVDESKDDADGAAEEGAGDEESANDEAARKVGDFHVQRFSGTYRKTPITMTEKIIAKKGNVFTFEYTFEQGKKAQLFQVRATDGLAKIHSVVSIENGQEIAVSHSVFEKLLAETIFVPDTNEGEIASATSTCLIGDKETSCHVTKYKVRFQNTDGTLSVAKNKSGVISGEVAKKDGTIVYKSTLIETGNERDNTQSFASLRH